MSLAIIRISIYSILPFLVAGAQVGLDKSTNTRERRLELFLIYLFSLGVAGSGIAGFISHFFISDIVAESIGWPTGSPFQLEVAFANLLLGILGLIAAGRRDGFREATVIAVTVFGVGATIVHLMDIFETGNLAPGNTVQNFANLLRPALLIYFLVASRRAERAPDSEVRMAEFDIWRGPRLQAAGWLTACVATGFGVGFALNLTLYLTLLGIVVGLVVVWLVISRAPLEARQGYFPSA
jgi:4-amino-4-deoxy-L-arabinose transferase-like glycosyltransferase